MASLTQDLDIEAKTDDDKIVASESETREAKKKKVEQKIKDANQEEESRGGTMIVPSRTTTKTSQRSLAEEEEKAREDEDDSEQTLGCLRRWKAPETPPEKIIHRILVEQCSRPIRKQLTTSDVKQNRLSLSNSQVRKKFQQLLSDESWKNESRFTIYGPDGKVHEMWLGKKRSSFDLTIGWWTFVEEYGLKECCDFVTVWMFRHRVTQRICLAIDVTTFALRKEVSKRISEAAFEDSD
ncbi:putative B3 domain-containing protein [Raphanus sativus]|uniref:B3 domain-containing protein At4g03170 n=1 Tax=Raphanus sativus TaxID=3726 RepID=A0A6J0M4H1_RAPSA|nr:putative B3 domain-containing protein At4g03170 [Raphanus sativus]KAJ4891989.1 putative B3 domain-containing protein [Raphanus sativus]